MATYVLPQVQVFQDFTIQPVVPANPLSAHISGGHAFLVRESESSERELGDLGLYDNAVDNDYPWPNRPTGGVVDTSYTKLFIENALLRYYSKPASASYFNTLAGYPNRIYNDTQVLKTNSYASRDADLYDRDVAIGDVVKVRGVPTGTDATGDPVTLWTYVKDLVADQIPAVIGTPSADAVLNAGTQGYSGTASQTAGPENCVQIATVTGSGYNGMASGKVSETYVIKVTESSVNGDLTTAKLRVLSGSGTDDQVEVTPSAAGVPTAIGTRGLTVTFDANAGGACSDSADAGAVPPDDLIVGQEFTVEVNQAVTASVCAAGTGTAYNSRQNTTYIVKVTKGGLYATSPEISVTTTNGVDQSGPHIVTNNNVDVAIGTRGVKIKFTAGLGLVKGDQFYVTVTGITDGDTKTLVLGHSLDQTYDLGTDLVAVDLYIRKPLLEVSANRTNFAPLTNWEQSATALTVKSGIVAYDSTWTDGGVPMALDVYSSAAVNYGKMFVEYRAWLPDLASKVNSIINSGTLADISGSLTPDNPLKWGVYLGLQNNNGTPVLYTSVTDPNNVDAWTSVLEVLLTRDDAYNLVPLTRNSTVLNQFKAHVNSCSSPTEGLWRVAWFNLAGIPEIPVVSAGSTVPGYTAATTTDGEEALAIFTETDEVPADSTFVYCRVPAANANFVANGVRAGDIVRALYANDGFGNYSYTEFVVDAVLAEDALRLKTGTETEQLVPAKIEVWRNLSAAEEAVAIGQYAASYGDRRVRATWPDTIETSGTVQPGYFLNCALAGLASGVLPHQGLTNVEVSGFTSATRSKDKFNKTQLDDMAVRGVWIVTQNNTGTIYTRHAVTTGDYADINAREEMITRNVDSISYRFKDYFAPFIGVTNVTPTMRDIILGGINKLIRTLQVERTTPSLGGQLINATVESFYISSLFKDRYVAFITMSVPYSTNTIELHLVV